MQRIVLSSFLPALFLLLFTSTFVNAQPILEGERSHPVQGKNGMVVTSHFLATEAALEVLEKGGNAIDAAVTAAFSLAVTQPRSGNIGGGGFMLISSEKNQEVIAIDYREKAPLKAHKDMFLNSEGEVDNQLSRFSHLSAAGNGGGPGPGPGAIRYHQPARGPGACHQTCRRRVHRHAEIQ